jgi:hypothetical protein
VTGRDARPTAARRWVLPPAGVIAAISLYAVAMAYLEAAVVVYLRAALGVGAGDVFPVDFSASGNHLGFIELGREAATLVMIGSVGWIVGRSPLERLAWAAVVFGIWDIGYYAWLWVFSGWPPSVGTWDLLFLLPVPWAGPVWAPVAVSAGLICFGLVFAGRLRSGIRVRLGRAQLAVLLLGGLVIIVSFVLNAGIVLAGGTPTSFAWPIFAVGMAIGVATAVRALQTPMAVRIEGTPEAA